MDCLNGTSKKSLASQPFSRRRRQRKKRYFSPKYWAMEIAANISRCGQLQARERRLQQKENCLYNLAEREFSVSGLIRRDGGDARRGPTMFARISIARPPRSR